VPVYCIDNFYSNETYLNALVEKIDEALASFLTQTGPI